MPFFEVASIYLFRKSPVKDFFNGRRRAVTLKEAHTQPEPHIKNYLKPRPDRTLVWKCRPTLVALMFQDQVPQIHDTVMES